MLSREFLAIDLNNNDYIMQYGFLSEGDYFYEIINDYITLDILNDLNSRLSCIFDYLLLHKKHSSGYLDLDDICSNPISKVYKWSKSLIVDSLIGGEGKIFVNVIGKDNYDNMNKLLINIYDWLKKSLSENPKEKKEKFRIGEKAKHMFDLYLDSIYRNLVSYNQYKKNLKQQLDEMEKSGTVRKI